MAGIPLSPEWITALATAATAFAAGLTALFGWIGVRRDSRRQLPIVEADVRWNGSGEQVELMLIVRNLLYETLVLHSIAVVAPKGMRVCTVLYDGSWAPKETGRIFEE